MRASGFGKHCKGETCCSTIIARQNKTKAHQPRLLTAGISHLGDPPRGRCVVGILQHNDLNPLSGAHTRPSIKTSGIGTQCKGPPETHQKTLHGFQSRTASLGYRRRQTYGRTSRARSLRRVYRLLTNTFGAPPGKSTTLKNNPLAGRRGGTIQDPRTVPYQDGDPAKSLQRHVNHS